MVVKLNVCTQKSVRNWSFLKLISHIEFHKKVKFGLFANEKIEILSFHDYSSSFIILM